jgi:hypothetical protein
LPRISAPLLRGGWPLLLVTVAAEYPSVRRPHLRGSWPAGAALLRNTLLTCILLAPVVTAQTNVEVHATAQPSDVDLPVALLLAPRHGPDFTSRHLEQVAADLKIRLVFSLPG